MCYELHPGEDLHDGVTFERFFAAVDDHPRANILFDPSHFMLQQLDYFAFVDIYHARIKAFHVKDVEFRPNGKQGVYGGYSGWIERAGRFRLLGDGQIDFKAIFSKMAHNTISTAGPCSNGSVPSMTSRTAARAANRCAICSASIVETSDETRAIGHGRRRGRVYRRGASDRGAAR